VLAGPAGMPRAVVDRLNSELAKVMQSQETRTHFANIGGDPFTTTPEQATAYLRSEQERWTKVIRDAGVKVTE
jgi:tripartite-type tricarboxylate transporter receptor subunit TctC